MSDYEWLRKILLRTRDRTGAWEGKTSSTSQRLRAEVNKYYPAMEERQLEGQISKAKTGTLDLTKGREFVHLPSPESGDFLPILVFKLDYQGPNPSATFKLMLFAIQADQIHSCGFRFETPEKVDAPRPYSHVQGIRSFSKQDMADQSLSHVRSWIPETLPAFLLPAVTPSQVAIWMIASLYGLSFAVRLCSEIGNPGLLKKAVSEFSKSFAEPPKQ